MVAETPLTVLRIPRDRLDNLFAGMADVCVSLCVCVCVCVCAAHILPAPLTLTLTPPPPAPCPNNTGSRRLELLAHKIDTVRQERARVTLAVQHQRMQDKLTEYEDTVARRVIQLMKM